MVGLGVDKPTKRVKHWPLPGKPRADRRWIPLQIANRHTLLGPASDRPWTCPTTSQLCHWSRFVLQGSIRLIGLRV